MTAPLRCRIRATSPPQRQPHEGDNHRPLGRVRGRLSGRASRGRTREPAHRGTPVTFTYDDAVLGDQTAAVSVRLPVRAAPFPEYEALPCFENLLPDGDLRALLAASVRLASNDVVGLLGVFGGECAGALSLWPNGQTPPAVPTYRPCTAADVHGAFAPSALAAAADLAKPSRPDDAGGSVSAGLARVLARGRISMSGAQEKLVLYRRPQTGTEPPGTAPDYRLPVAGAPSTVLVKRERSRFPGLLQNELASMAMMRSAGVPTAEHTVCALDGAVYETARFDPECKHDGSVTRLHAEDGWHRWAWWSRPPLPKRDGDCSVKGDARPTHIALWHLRA